MVLDDELQDVKRELSRLKGATIYTVPYGKPNLIVDVSSDKGFLVQTEDKSKPSWVSWDKVLDGYNNLRRSGELSNIGRVKPFSYRGAFVMPLLAKLTTAEFSKRNRPRTLRYLPGGRPPRLRD